jgi:hypothetical protein
VLDTSRGRITRGHSWAAIRQAAERKGSSLHVRVLASLLPTLSLAGGCRSITYLPQLSLGASSATIGATVRIDDFRDQTPAQDQ